MNKLTYLSVLCSLFFILTSCGDTLISKETKAQTTIENMINANLNDPSTYESIEYSALDSVNLVEIDPFFLSLKEKAKDQGRNYTEQIQQAYLSLEIAKTLSGIDLDEKKSGYKIIHKFRAQNDYGLLALSTYVFYLNSDLTEVLYSEVLE